MTTLFLLSLGGVARHRSSQLVILAKLSCFDLLNRLFPRLYISTEVQHEMVASSAGLPGALEAGEGGG
jgi:hypothetical protein